MNNVAAISQNVKTAACVVLFDAKYLGKFRNRKFGQGIEAKPVEAPAVGKSKRRPSRPKSSDSPRGITSRSTRPATSRTSNRSVRIGLRRWSRPTRTP